MFVRAVILALVALGLASGDALADDLPACAITPVPWEFQPDGPYRYQAALEPLVGEAQNIASGAVGAQFVMLWFNTAQQGWDIGLAPGPLDVDDARSAIVSGLTASFSPTDAALLINTLHVEPEPYNATQLQTAQEQVVAALSAANLGVGFGVVAGACTLSDGMRVEVELYNDSTPAIVTRVQALLAPFGDIVRMGVSPYGPPEPTAGVAPGPPAPTPSPPTPLPTPGVGRYLTLPTTAACVHGATVHIRLRPGMRAAVRSLRINSTGRTRTIAASHTTTPIAVGLHGRVTHVEITVRLTDGRDATRNLTLTRCA